MASQPLTTNEPSEGRGPAESSIHDSHTISQELECSSCGYNLFSMHLESQCPECSTPVADSVLFALQNFKLGEWKRKSARGLIVLSSGLFGYVLLNLVLFLKSDSLYLISGATAKAIYLLPALLMCAGTFLLPRPLNCTPNDKPVVWARWMARLCVVGLAAVIALFAIVFVGQNAFQIKFYGVGQAQFIEYIRSIDFTATTLASLYYVSIAIILDITAIRLSIPWLIRSTRLLVWAFVIYLFASVTHSILEARFETGGALSPALGWIRTTLNILLIVICFAVSRSINRWRLVPKVETEKCLNVVR